MTTRIAYQSIDLIAPARVFGGRQKVDSVEAVNNVTIDRITDGPLDFFIVKGPQVCGGESGYEIGAIAVVGGIRKPLPALRGKSGKASDDERV